MKICLVSRTVLSLILSAVVAAGAFAQELTPIAALPNPNIIDSAEAFHNGLYSVENIFKDGCEYASQGKGTDTFIDFDFGKPVLLGAFKHTDRTDVTTLTKSKLLLSNSPDFKTIVGTVDITHHDKPGGVVFATFKPIEARYVRWQVVAIGAKGHPCVGGSRFAFFETGRPLPITDVSTNNHETIDVKPLQAVVKRDGKKFAQVQVEVDHEFLESLDATVQIADGPKRPIKLSTGKNTVELEIPAVERIMEVAVRLEAGGKTLAEKTVSLAPVRPWTLYYLPHSHVDIGYTHVQTDVMKRQWEHLDLAIDLAEKTADYPQGARFKWNVEVLWAVDSFLKQAPQEKKKRFVAAVRRGVIGIDALYGNELTGLCRPEELMRLFDCANRLRREYGFEIDSAMISDVPGYTWGMAPALSQNGIKYFSVGPNHCHRIGYTLDAWGDKPFYWVGPAGKNKVLFWMDGKGYAWYLYDRGLNEEKIFKYLDKLIEQNYPYDMVQVRYTIGADNGPPDPELPEFVRAWNAKYEWPKIEISTTSPMMRRFEQRWGDKLPEMSGDFTPYWEDGAASTARETAQARGASDRLVQAEALWAMLRAKDYADEDFYAAWRNVMLYNEHTWGAHCSISRPDDPFTKSQWAIKRNFAVDAEKQSRELVELGLDGRKAAAGDTIAAVDVYNTCSWPRTDLVLLPAEMKLAGETVKTRDGQTLRSQRLASGELAVLVENVPPFAAKRLVFAAGQSAVGSGKTGTKDGGTTIGNAMLAVTVDKQRGAITALKTADGHNLVDAKGGLGLNEYLYQAGRKPGKLAGASGAKITVVDGGPLVATLVVESDAPGCKGLTQSLRVVDGLERVDIINRLDKKAVRTKESVHLGFAFDVPEGQMRVDTPWAVVRPELDQLPGSCKNYLTVGRWVDISNKDFGVTWATLDAPLVEVGRVSVDVKGPMSKDGWLKKLDPSSTFFSYVMNNYWETNYKADQGGMSEFRYSIRPHQGGFDAGVAARFGIERSRAMVVAPLNEKQLAAAKGPVESLLSVESSDVIVTSLKPSRDGKGLMLRLFNPGAEPSKASIRWASGGPRQMFISRPDEAAGKAVGESVDLPGQGILTLRCVGK